MQKILQFVPLENRDSFFTIAKWSIFAVMILTYVLVYFHRMAPGVVGEHLMSAFETTGTQLGALSAIYFFVYAFMQIPSGVIADTIGTRTSIVGGNLIAGVGSILFGLSSTFYMACLGRFFVGLGVSVVFVSIMKSNSVWFHERVFAFMSGLTLLIGNLGSVLAAAPLAMLLDNFTWRTIFIGIGVFSLVLSALAYLIIENRPEDMGLESPNIYERKTGDHKQVNSGNWWSRLASVMLISRVWPGFWVQFGMVGSLYAFMGLWGMRYLGDVHNIDSSIAAQHMTLMLLSFAFGALFFGWLSDHLGKRKILLVTTVIGYLICWLILVYAPWSAGWQGYLLFSCIGLMGSGFVLTFAAAKEVIDPELSGMAVSVVNTGCFLGTALMQPLFGMVVDWAWDGTQQGGVRIYSAGNYEGGFMLCLLFAAIAVIGALRVHETGGRNITV